ncbi:selenoprotein M-like [Pectinophora gossypiella]|uniref:Selenoprotein M n=1 Tax=Pectinophora gossypiella TaxID=13191 RepID=A0A1E1WNI9_PECGO|nr:selenoprotein M-like [Pectinophora gossypiella]
MKLLLLTVGFIFVNVSAFENSDIVSARIESCRGCSLNRLPEVKKFIMEDAPKFERVEVKFITGAPPELILLGEGDRELERLPLSQLTRSECNDLLNTRGFTITNKKSEF